MKTLRNALAALGIAGASFGAGTQIAPSSAVHYCANGWIEDAVRAPAQRIPGATADVNTTTCIGPDGTLIVVDGDGNPIHALDAGGNPLSAPRTYLR